MDNVTKIKDECAHLEERVRKLALEKSYLQLVIRLINRVSAAAGLEDTIDCMLSNILDVVGGANIILYYWFDGDIFSADVYGKKMQIAAIDDELVQRVVSSHESIEFEHEFSATRMMTPEFTKAYTWVYPLLVGPELIGVLKMESLHINMRELYQYLPTFFAFVALTLKNDILGHGRLKQAYDLLRNTNKDLLMEIEERERVEDQLRKSTEELEKKNRELERMNRLFVGRELRMIELKEKIKALEKKAGTER